MTKDSAKLQIAFDEAAKVMANFIKLGVEEDDEIRAKLAMGTLGVFARLKAAENNESIIKVDVARIMSDSDTSVLKAHLQKSLPEYAS